jgi:hypothetical protein
MERATEKAGRQAGEDTGRLAQRLRAAKPAPQGGDRAKDAAKGELERAQADPRDDDPPASEASELASLGDWHRPTGPRGPSWW